MQSPGSRQGKNPHIGLVETREELIYLLSRASELEHGVACIYLFAAHSLKSDVSEGGMTSEQAGMVRRWKRKLSTVAVEEMLHLAQLTNVLTAIGGAPHFRRTNFPVPPSALPINDYMTLEPFSLETIERFMTIEMPEAGILSPGEREEAELVALRVCGRVGRAAAVESRPRMATGCEPFDVDFATQGEFYHKIMTGIACIPEDELFIGPLEAQANSKYIGFEGQLLPVKDRASALAAIQNVIEQGEAPTVAHPDAHFWVFRTIWRQYREALQQAEAAGKEFNPVRPVIANPSTRFYDDAGGGTLISHPLTHQVADLYNGAYDTMLLMLLRFFAHGGETETELEKLGRGTLRLMQSVTRPLGEALAKMPAGHNKRLKGRVAGPGFGYNRDIHLLPHKRSAWVFFGERLHEAATIATGLWVASSGRLPPEIEEATAALQSLALDFASSDRQLNAAAEMAEFRAMGQATQAEIKPTRNGPLLISNLPRLENSHGEALPISPEMALCRCGASKNKPFCDGNHAKLGFSSDRDSDHTPDEVKDFPGREIVVHFNKLQCSAAGECWRGLPGAFIHGQSSRGGAWIQPDREFAQKVIDVIRRCPSGALRYTLGGDIGPDHPEPAIMRIRRNGPYEVIGNITLCTPFWMKGQTRQIYALCRCGASKNKPFCDGSHRHIRFEDEHN